MLRQPTMQSWAGVAAIASVCLLVTACGSSAPTPSATSAPTSLEPTSVAQATLSPTNPPTAATQPTASPTNQPAATSASAPQPQPPSADAVTLVIDASTSKASYRAREQLVGRTLPSEAVGTTTNVSGSLVLAADGSIQADQSNISVDLSKLQSDESRRDNFIKGSTLQTSRFPMATFVPREAQGLPSPLPTSGEATFQLVGDLTVHGVTRPVTWQVTAQFGDASVSGAATTDVNISDFGMTPPKAGPVLSIEDGLTLELAFTAARE